MHVAPVPLLLAALLGSPPPFLLKDICSNSPGVSPQDIVAWNGALAYTGIETAHGRELWRSDGTPGGSALVSDIYAGPSDSSIRGAAVVGARLVFFARTAAAGIEPWASDGTDAGTVLLADIDPGLQNGGAGILPIRSMGGYGWFLATRGGQFRLFRTDGTPAGTIEVIALGAAPSLFVATSDRLLFDHDDGVSGRELWVSDGTAAGTGLLLDISPGAPSTSLSDLTAIGDQVFFVVDQDLTLGREPWFTDGTPGGTIPLGDLNPGRADSMQLAEQFAGYGGLVWFEVKDAAGSSLWSSDGTAAGTQLAARLDAGPDNRTMMAAGGLLWMVRPDSRFVNRIWRSDGTAVGTFPLNVSAPDLELGDRAFATLGSETVLLGRGARSTCAVLLASDGTDFGTRPLTDFASVGNCATISTLVPLGSRVFFAAPAGADDAWWQESYDLWATDGTPAGTGRVAEPLAPATGRSTLDRMFHAGDQVCFSAFPGGSWSDRELWCTDGSTGGTRPVPVACEPGMGCVSMLGEIPTGVVLSVDGGPAVGREPWIYDGITAVPLGNLCAGPCSAVPDPVMAGSVFSLLGLYTTPLNEPWRTDGTPQGTFALAPGTSLTSKTVADLGGILVFGNKDATGSQPWRSDGTPTGTFPLLTLAGPDGCNPQPIGVVGGQALFAASLMGGIELWATTGTGPGTKRIRDLCPAPCNATVLGPLAAGERLFFYLTTDASTTFWTTDGTAAGTTSLGPPSTRPVNWLGSPPSAHGRVYFETQSTTALELWSTDGTPAGTTFVATLVPGAQPLVYPVPLHAAGGRVWSTGYDPVTGLEPWSSDGTAAGSGVYGDIVPGPGSSLVRSAYFPLTSTPTHLLFPADDGVHGMEPWAIELDPGFALLRAPAVPLDPVRDRYIEHFFAGDADPEPGLLSSRVRPLLFYSLEGVSEIHLVKSPIGQIRILD